jgi:hypothetical protein
MFRWNGRVFVSGHPNNRSRHVITRACTRRDVISGMLGYVYRQDRSSITEPVSPVHFIEAQHQLLGSALMSVTVNGRNDALGDLLDAQQYTETLFEAYKKLLHVMVVYAHSELDTEDAAVGAWLEDAGAQYKLLSAMFDEQHAA